MNAIEVGTRAHQVLCCVEWGIRLGWFGPVSEEKKARMVERVSERWTGDNYTELRALVADRRLADEFSETREEFAHRTGIRIGGARPTKRSKMEAQMWKNAGWTKPATQGTNVLRHVCLDSIRVEVRNSNLEIVGTAQRLQAAVISFTAFEQLAEALDAPASYLRTLGPTLVAQNLNHRLKGAHGTVDLHTDVDGAVVVLSKIEHEKEHA